MSKFVNNKVKKMQAYSPPIEGRAKFDGLLLDFNERTLPPSDKIVDAMIDFAKSGRVQTYPEYADLNTKIANYAGVKSSQVMAVNGSDQAIDVIFRTFTDAGDKIMIPRETFAMFAQRASLNGNEIVYEFDEDVRLIVICNPNNPTGEVLTLNDIEVVLKKAVNAVVYVDEAYFEYSDVSAVSLLNKYPNLVISRTFSKAWGLASLRVGYVLASSENISEMLKVRGPYDVNMMACCAVIAALEDSSYMYEYVDEVMNVAKPMVEKFFDDNGIEYIKSFSNFILFKPAKFQNSSYVFNKLNERGVRLRMRGDKIRLTVGTKNQMLKFISTYKDVLSRAVKCAFIDRDGTLIFESRGGGIVKDFQIIPGAIKALKKMKEQGFRFVMVTNQDGLGTQYFPKKVFNKVQNKLISTLKKEGVEFDAVFICPHFESDNCACRKPKIGMLDRYLKDVKVDLKNSVMIGDRDSDEVFARNLGVKFIRIKNNKFKYET
ncbi:MAG TPA: histidinol-phosphatase [Candidatus Gracilibacteria bacterium]|nr:histidinol-phosphatase [Candidatus Gracilibacteria bacterium]